MVIFHRYVSLPEGTNQLRMWLPLESLEIVYCTRLMKIGCRVLKIIVDGVLHQYGLV